jgi:hypothetical protein
MPLDVKAATSQLALRDSVAGFKNGTLNEHMGKTAIIKEG